MPRGGSKLDETLTVRIPENIGFEETLVGPLTKAQTAKLFIPVFVSVGLVYAVGITGWLRYAIVGICALIGAVFAFVKVGGMPLDSALASWLVYRARPRQAFGKENTKLFVDVADVSGDIVVLPGGRYVQLVEVKGINYEFTSEQEKSNIITGYEGFLNSLDFDVQVLSRPEKYVPLEYIETLCDRFDAERDPKLRHILADYIEFFDDLADEIIEHRFYVAVSMSLKRDAPELAESAENERLQKAEDILGARSRSVIAMLSILNIKGRILEGSEAFSVYSKYYGGGTR